MHVRPKCVPLYIIHFDWINKIRDSSKTRKKSFLLFSKCKWSLMGILAGKVSFPEFFWQKRYWYFPCQSSFIETSILMNVFIKMGKPLSQISTLHSETAFSFKMARKSSCKFSQLLNSVEEIWLGKQQNWEAVDAMPLLTEKGKQLWWGEHEHPLFLHCLLCGGMF